MHSTCFGKYIKNDCALPLENNFNPNYQKLFCSRCTLCCDFCPQLQNPETQALMTNPQALNAIMQIQQGLSTLQSTAPSLFPG